MKKWMYAGIPVVIGLMLVAVYFMVRENDKSGSDAKPPHVATAKRSGEISGDLTEKGKDRLPSVVKKIESGQERSTPETAESGKLLEALADANLTGVERNQIEHLLAAGTDESIDVKIRAMLEDGLVALSEPGTLNDGRLMSAVRVAGLREDKQAVDAIMQVCSHPNADEGIRLFGYEAFGYIATDGARQFLRQSFSTEPDEYLKSRIVLSLGISKDSASADRILPLLKSPDPDIRQSAIVALGKMQDQRAVAAFKNMYKDAQQPARVLIAKALKDIDTDEAAAALREIEQ